MTSVRVDLRVPYPNGTHPAATTRLTWTPTRRRHIEDGDDDYIVLPAPFDVLVTEPATIVVDPTDGTWAWKVAESGAIATTRYVAVPDSDDVLEYGDLVDVDAGTLDPEAPLTPAWQAYIDEQLEDVVHSDDARLTNSRTPTGAAGGVLAGMYPNPSFAVDMATQAELDSHASAEVTARNAAIQAALASLVNAAPGALDQLNELAAALGNDPSFATTILNALASEATLARNADNLASGTVAEARIAASIARDTEVTAAVAAEAARANRVALFAQARQDPRYLQGPLVAAPDVPTVTTGAGNANLTAGFAVGAGPAIPDTFPVDVGDGPFTIVASNLRSVPAQMPRLWRVWCDGDRISFRVENNTVVDHYLAWVNGHPVSLTPAALPSTGNWLNLVFTDARPRLVEIVTTAGLNSVWTGIAGGSPASTAAYRLWKPTYKPGPRVLVVGDSFPMGATLNGSDSTESARVNGWAATIGMRVGAQRVIVDGVGGTGFIRVSGGGGNNLNDRRAQHIATAPDMLVVSALPNDKFEGYTNAEIIAAATTYFTQVRAALPHCKLVQVDGLTPPLSPYSTFGADYLAIRTALQAALVDVGVYYVDTLTTPWISGTGKIGATTNLGNSDIYIGGDGLHPSIAGHRYLRDRLAPKLATVMADTGALLNTLI